MNTLGPTMLLGVGIFIAWAAITGRLGALSDAITQGATQSANGGGASSPPPKPQTGGWAPDPGKAGNPGSGGSWAVSYDAFGHPVQTWAPA